MVYNRIVIADTSHEVRNALLNSRPRVESIDVLRGIVMIIMALDHVRAYFHFDTFLFSPTDLQKTNVAMFATRFITHLCAPTFIFLAGTSAYFISQRKTLKETSVFLITRGLWLVLLQVTVIQFAWNFDPLFHFTSSNIISTIGICMILMSVIIHLPLKVILAMGLIVVAGHNLLDNVSFESGSSQEIFWSFLHQRKLYQLRGDYSFLFLYPIIPWIGVMALGYCLGRLYQKYTTAKKKELLLILGLVCLTAFLVLRGAINTYGDPTPWSHQRDVSHTVLSFFNLEKYPPSLDFLCFTIGISLIVLGTLEGIDVRRWKPIALFGNVALFYYVVHIYVIHLLALVTVSLMGYPWKTMIFTGPFIQAHPMIKGHFGFGLSVTYLIWAGVVLLLYPLCMRWYSFKRSNKLSWWVSYV